jgi:tryptophan-rich sensory protein
MVVFVLFTPTPIAYMIPWRVDRHLERQDGRPTTVNGYRRFAPRLVLSASPANRGLMTRIPVSKQVLGLLGWLMLTFAAAAAGGVAAANAGAFYQELTRPAWAPPAWLFAPVWGLLYLLIGIAAWIVWRLRGFRGAGTALSLFLVQLAANALWTWLFFAWQRGTFAFAEILVLWTLILCTVVAFWRVRPLAGVLLFPYLAWVTFASALTFATWQLNPQIFT